MRYLHFAADYMHPTLVDMAEDAQHASLFDDLDSDLRIEIEEWNARYQPIIQMDLSERGQNQEVISDLDKAGVLFANRIEKSFGPAKVQYFSEGLLRNLTNP